MRAAVFCAVSLTLLNFSLAVPTRSTSPLEKRSFNNLSPNSPTLNCASQYGAVNAQVADQMNCGSPPSYTSLQGSPGGFPGLQGTPTPSLAVAPSSQRALPTGGLPTTGLTSLIGLKNADGHSVKETNGKSLEKRNILGLPLPLPTKLLGKEATEGAATTKALSRRLDIGGLLGLDAVEGPTCHGQNDAVNAGILSTYGGQGC